MCDHVERTISTAKSKLKFGFRTNGNSDHMDKPADIKEAANKRNAESTTKRLSGINVAVSMVESLRKSSAAIA